MRRTLEVVTDYRGPWDATLQLNCLLGLLVVPKEACINSIPLDPISDLANWGISPNSIEATGSHLDATTLRGVVRGLRNAVAHFRFAPIEELGQCTGFRFSDASGFRARITNIEMRDFVTRLAAFLADRP